MSSWVLLPQDLVCLVVCAISVATDLRDRRIPNWLTASGVALGLLLNTVLFSCHLGFSAGLRLGLLSSLSGCLILVLVFGFFGLINFVGMGDVKLMAAVGALLRWPTALWAMAYTAMAGGAVALAYALVKGRLFKVLGNLLTISSNMVRKKDQRKEAQLHRIPYALAIFIGAVWAAGLKYFPALRIP